MMYQSKIVSIKISRRMSIKMSIRMSDDRAGHEWTVYDRIEYNQRVLYIIRIQRIE